MVFVFHSNPGNRNTILIQFSGHNASKFYAILKSQKFNWQIFNLNNLTLGRLDINYIMLNQRIDKSNLLSFFKRSADKFKTRYPNSNPQIIGTTLGLGTRTGDFFLRLYTPDNISLKFELEIKKYKAKQVTKFLINNYFAEFENSIVDSFLRYLKIALVFDTCYTDWFLRIIRRTHKPLAKELSSYSYPFQFSTYFTTYKYNYQFQVKLQIIQAISVQSLKKQFYVQDFLSQFNVSHAKQTQIKNVIIQTLDELKKNQVIQAQIEIHKTDNSFIKTNIITARLLTKTKIVYFYEIIQSQNLVL